MTIVREVSFLGKLFHEGDLFFFSTIDQFGRCFIKSVWFYTAHFKLVFVPNFF